MLSIKKSLRAKFTIILFFVGVVPLVLSTIFFYFSAKDALFRTVFKELRWNVDEISSIIESHFSDTAKDLVIASKNTAFTMYFLDTGKKNYWAREQQRTLKHIRDIYPDILDEACFIESTGKEVSRIVLDRIASESELSSGEERTDFFIGAFLMEEGEVFQGRPVISEDTKRWVLPNATPVAVSGKKAAILHFEINMTYFQRLLKRSINPDRGYGFIINDSGEFMAHTLINISETKPFPRAITPGTPPVLADIFKRMMKGESGIEQFNLGGKDYYIVFKPIGAYVKGRNENRWAVGYAISGDRVYLEMSLIRYNMMMGGAVLLFLFFLAYTIGKYVTMPIKELSLITKKVAAGEMPRIEVRREDELGQLLNSFKTMVDAIKKRDEALKSLAITDGLTGLYNYRYFMMELEKDVKVAKRFDHALSLIIADVDFFKYYNDAHGHAQGDMALKLVAKLFLKNSREVDLVARYGGEEFVIILPETDLKNAVMIAERIRQKIEEEAFPFGKTQPGGGLTVSMGVATLSKEVDTAKALVEAADRALYKVKKEGRNKVAAE